MGLGITHCCLRPWSVPPFLSGWLGSGGDLRNVVLQGILIIIGVAVYLPFLHAYERAIMSKNTRKIIEDIEQTPSDTTEINNTSDGHVLDGKTIILMCNEGMSTSMVAKKCACMLKVSIARPISAQQT